MSSSSASRLPAASPGLAFVAFTRVTDWERMGFRCLPPLSDFLAVCSSKLFSARQKFEVEMDVLHDTTLHRWQTEWADGEARSVSRIDRLSSLAVAERSSYQSGGSLPTSASAG